MFMSAAGNGGQVSCCLTLHLAGDLLRSLRITDRLARLSLPYRK